MTVRVSSITFEWVVENYSQLEDREYRSPTFSTNDYHKWAILFYPFGNKVMKPRANCMSIYVTADTSVTHEKIFFPRRDVRIVITMGPTIPQTSPPHSRDTKSSAGGPKEDGHIEYPFTHTFMESDPDWGFASFCDRNWIVNPCPGDRLIFEIRISYPQIAEPRTPSILVDLLHSQLDSPSTADVEFHTADGRVIYAQRTILTRQSDYFRALFSAHFKEGIAATWGNSPHAQEGPSTSTIECQQTIPTPSHRVKVNVTDFSYDTFYALLSYLYTTQLHLPTYQDSPSTPTSTSSSSSSSLSASNPSPHANLMKDLYRCSDKYQIVHLRDLLTEHISVTLHPSTVAEDLFEFAYCFPPLRMKHIQYLVENYSRVKETPGFRRVMEQPECYEEFASLMMEIMDCMKPG